MNSDALRKLFDPASDDISALLTDQIEKSGHSITVILGADADDALVDKLMTLARVESIILSRASNSLRNRHQGRLGWHEQASEQVHLPRKMGPSVYHFAAGGQWNLGSRAAYAAWRGGVKTVRFHDACLGVFTIGMKTLLLQEAWKSLIYRFGRSQLVPIIEALIQRFLHPLQDATLKVKADSHATCPGRIVFAVGSLGPGGSERQVVNTILGLRAHGIADVILVHERPMAPPNDFFHDDLVRAEVPCLFLESAGETARPHHEEERQAKLIRKHLMACGGHSDLVLSFLRVFRDQRPEIVHTWLDDVNVHAGLAAVLAGVPKIALGSGPIKLLPGRSAADSLMGGRTPSMSDLFWLSERQLAKTEPHFPLSHGVPRVDDRRVISGIVHVIRNGLRWRDAPPVYGPHKTLYNRFVRWRRLGVFSRIFAALTGEAGPPDRLMIDATHLKAHRTAASLYKKGLFPDVSDAQKAG